jgi:hypothetical protein
MPAPGRSPPRNRASGRSVVRPNQLTNIAGGTSQTNSGHERQPTSAAAASAAPPAPIIDRCVGAIQRGAARAMLWTRRCSAA